MRNRNFQKKNEKENQKGESKKKNEKPYFKTQKKTWKIHLKKDVHQKKRKQTKPSILGTEEKRKRNFANVYKDTKICQESIGYRKQRDNQRTRKKQNLKVKKRVREPRKH